jgi:hypothetical protein
MTQMVRICKYGCNAELGDFNTKENKYLEIDGTLHTRQRCESLKKQTSLPSNNGNGNSNDISVDVLLARLKQLGITIDLQKLRNVK